MANGALKLRAIVWTAFQETMRRKVFLLVVVLLAFVVIGSSADAVTVQMASEANETKVVTEIHTGSVTEILQMWNVALVVLSLYLGAVAVPSEVANKTLVNILSRPIARSTYLAGRWLGTLAFLWIFQLIGLGIALGLARFFRTPHTALLWLGCAQTLVTAAFLSGVSVAFSIVVPPILAGAFALVLPWLPDMAHTWLQHPRWVVRALANAVHYIAPASMPVDLIGDSFTKQAVHPAYGLYAQVLAENLLYAIVLFVFACAIFSRREVRLR